MNNHIARVLSRCGVRGRRGVELLLPTRNYKTYRGSIRWKVTAIQEPPLDCEVLEKPCTLVLLEDPCPYQTPWHESLQSSVPTIHGMSYASLTFGSSYGLDGMIEEMKADLPAIHDAILVTRGPIASWVALFYLESFPLKGLVMVDPISFDHRKNEVGDDDVEKFSREILQHFGSTEKKKTEEIAAYRFLVQEAAAKRLKLEPNSVPILVVQSIDNLVFEASCQQVAERHSDPDGPFGEVMIKQVFDDDPDPAVYAIDDWVESIL
jgi:hypothetical protein